MHLCNLTQSDAAAALPLPCAPAPTSAEDQRCEIDQAACTSDAVLVQQVVRALQDIDTSYLCPRRTVPATEHSMGPLERALLEADPHIFDCPNAGTHAAEPAKVLPGRPATPVHRKRSSRMLQADMPPAVSRASLTAEGEGGNDSGGIGSDADERAWFGACDGADAAAAARDAAALGEAVVRGRAGGVLPDADVCTLAAALGALGARVAAGQGAALGPDIREESEDAQVVLAALEAAITSLHILGAHGMPQQVYNEDAIERIAELVRFNLQSNVLALHDARLAAIHRPALLAQEEAAAAGEEDAERCTKRPRRGRPAVEAVRGRVEVALEALGGLLAAVRLPAHALGPLLRASAQALTVDGLDVLQVKAVGLLAAGFQHQSSHRAAQMEELLSSVLPLLPGGGRRVTRVFVVAAGSAVAIQMVAALLLQMLQACVELPSVDSEPGALRDCYAPALFWADIFWQGMFDRMAAKNASDCDMRALVRALTTDIVALRCLPAWPAADAALLRLVGAAAGTRGLGAPDAATRQTSVDILGSIAAAVCAGNRAAEEDEAALAELLQEAGKSATGAAIDRVADGVDHGKDAAPGAAALLVACRQAASELAGGGAGCGLGAEDAARLARAAAAAGPLGRGRSALLRRLVEAADGRQAATVRAHAVRALGGACKADARLLGLAEVQAGVNRALDDEAASVRQAAVDLLGAHLAAQPDLAAAYFNVLVAASCDSATSVRKAAVRTLWEVCIRPPGSPRAAEACCAVLNRGGDPEESIQELVAQVFQGLWFATAGKGGAQRSAAERASQLAAVSAAAYEAGGRAIHLPLDASHALVVVMRKALEREAREQPRAWVAAARAVAAALLEGVLRAGEAGGDASGAECAAFPYLIALHALCLTDVELCLPPEDQLRFIRALAPYLKMGDGERKGGRGDENGERREAEALMATLAALEAMSRALPRLPPALATELQADLTQLVMKHSFIQVVAEACRALCALAASSADGALVAWKVTKGYLAWLQRYRGAGVRAHTNEANLCGRFLFIVGHMMRHGVDVIEPSAAAGGVATMVDDFLDLVLHFFRSSQAGVRVQELALQALGCLGIARPAALRAPGARAALTAALKRSAPAPWKTRALANLAELLKADEERLVVGQRQDGACASGKKRKGRCSKGKGEDGAAPALPTQNGEGDLSVSSSILQEVWEQVLTLATDTEPPSRPANHASPAPADPGSAVRRNAVAVMDAVDRNGLVAPWTTVPHLVALTTDPIAEVATRALRVLRRLAAAHPDFVKLGFTGGLAVAAGFHERLRAAYPASARACAGAPPSAISGLAAMYGELLQPVRALRCAFLADLLRPFDTASNLNGSGAAAADLPLLALCAALAAALPMRRADEPLLLLHAANSLVARRGAEVLASLKAALAASASSDAKQAGAAGAPASAALALSMLLLLGRHLRDGYGLAPVRVAAFAPGAADVRRAEERMPVAAAPGAELGCEALGQLRLDAWRDAPALRELHQGLKTLMRADAADLARAHAALGDAGAGEGGVVDVDEPAPGASPEQAGAAAAGTPAWAQGARVAQLRGGGTGTGSRKGSGGARARSRSRASTLRGSATASGTRKPRGTGRAARKAARMGSGDNSDDEAPAPAEGAQPCNGLNKDAWVRRSSRASMPKRRLSLELSGEEEGE
ncbi:hypothetical protein WJX81_004388 [Elliptochloris bilobata]|uniref:Sister chromatid cohesion protein n=1 Tax=Elliptochloris bilobata TaxID=381761 RepID=A0AAW1SI77_9CHLO